MFSVHFYLIGFRVYCDLGCLAVEFHVLFADVAAAGYRNHCFFQMIFCLYVFFHGCLRYKGQAGSIFCLSVSGKHRFVYYRFTEARIEGLAKGVIQHDWDR